MKNIYRPKKRADIYYTARDEDTLHSIAETHYGKRENFNIDGVFRKIEKANPKISFTGEAIQAGSKLKLPNAGELKEIAVYWIRYTCQGCSAHPIGSTHRESTGKTSLMKARQVLDIRKGAVAKGEPVFVRSESVLMSELLKDVENDYATNALRSLPQLKARIEKHVKPFFGNRKAVSISSAEIRQYIVMRQSGDKEKEIKPAKNATINRELAIVSRAFTLGQQCEKIQFKPHVPTLKEDNVRKGFFEADQFESFCKYLPDDLKAPIVFGYCTGWRLSEVFTREWQHVDFKRGVVRLEPGETKNGKGRMFPLTPQLLQLLKEQKARTEGFERANSRICRLVFHHDGESLIDSHRKPVKYMRKAWKHACNEAKLVGKIFHDFRRTAVRNFERKGISRQVAMQLSGHLSETIYRRYAIVSEQDLFEAVEKLSSAEKNSKLSAN